MAAPKTVATYDLNGSAREFDFPFDYLSRVFVKVTIIGTERRTLTVGTDYTFVSNNRIRTNLIYGPPEWTQIEIRRETSTTERLVDFQDASILRADDLNLSELQVLHVAEEAREAATETIGTNNFGHLDARGRRIVNVADPVELGDVVNRRWYEEDKSGAYAAVTLAEAARNKAQEWATKTGAPVEGGDYSAKAYATESRTQAQASSSSAAQSDTHRGNAVIAENKAKDWAIKATAVEGTNQSAKTYAAQSAASAATADGHRAAAASSASAASVSEGQAASSASSAANQVTLAANQVSLAQGQVTLATNQANRAENEADRAESEADRAYTNAQSVDGPYITAQLKNNTVAQSVHGGQLAGYRNVLHNGAMEVWQRGNGPFTATHWVPAFYADRWAVTRIGSGDFSIRMDTDAPPGQQLFESLTLQATGSHSLAAGDAVAISQGIEGYDARRLLGKTFTLSFWVNASRTGTYGVSFRSPTASKVYVLPYTVSTADAWQKVSLTVTGGIPSDSAFNQWGNGKAMSVMWVVNAGSNLKTASSGSWVSGDFVGTTSQALGLVSSGDTFKITGAQLELGAVATEFELMGAHAELARCQRYYEAGRVSACSDGAMAYVGAIQQFKVTKRAAPAVTVYDAVGNIGKVSFDAVNGIPSLVTSSTNYIRVLANNYVAPLNHFLNADWVASSEI